ncbi:putative toxin-antitoxin system toxin component, PIN family [Candidatus Poribacteria bacterium]|nr:putative toxin-antitoxin system toxin component, PIN family [Candidatus Poribacteria bacterium]
MTYIVVFDTNILFSGFGWRGNPFRCLQLAREGKMVSLTCREILAEFEEKLRLKRNMPAIHAARAVTEVLSFSRLITITNTLKVVIADPDDNKVLECAIVGGATYIVTGDHHLLSLSSYQNIPIVSSTVFLGLVSATCASI